jgi:cytochrome c-type protein NrfB
MQEKLRFTIVWGMLWIAWLAIMATISPAAENHGAENLVLDGGRQGKVAFPHRRHQIRLGDCNLCHHLFPQNTGAITMLKSDGHLPARKIMNTLCIKCHRTEKRAGRSAGPTSCSQCHHKG